MSVAPLSQPMTLERRRLADRAVAGDLERARGRVDPHQRHGGVRELDRRAAAHPPLPRAACRRARAPAETPRDPGSHGHVPRKPAAFTTRSRRTSSRASRPPGATGTSRGSIKIRSRAGRGSCPPGFSSRPSPWCAGTTRWCCVTSGEGPQPFAWVCARLLALRPFHGLVREHGSMVQSVELRQGEVRVRPVPALPRVVFGHQATFVGLARLVAPLRISRRAGPRPRLPRRPVDARRISRSTWSPTWPPSSWWRSTSLPKEPAAALMAEAECLGAAA